VDGAWTLEFPKGGCGGGPGAAGGGAN
jgi:hypothetical protein